MQPGQAHAAVCFGVTLLTIATGLFVLDVSLHVLLFFCLIWTALNARVLGHDFIAIRHMMNPGITQALPAIYIFCDLSTETSVSVKQGYMQRVSQEFSKKLPDHHIIVGDVEMKFAYITPQEALYHELKQDHRSKE